MPPGYTGGFIDQVYNNTYFSGELIEASSFSN